MSCWPAGSTLPRCAQRPQFEYYSEDPYLTAVLGAEAVNGIQGEGVISTLKHYTLNCNETNRHWLDAIIDPAALRESDLLAFQIAIERSQPGSIMSAYNKINGEYAGGKQPSPQRGSEGVWGYKGWVMSDWGAVPQWDFALAALTRSGAQLDMMMWKVEPFTGPLRKAYAEGKLPKSAFPTWCAAFCARSTQLGSTGAGAQVDMAKHNAVALEIARQGIVLLKNEGDLLPLAADKPLKIAVIGGYAQLGVPTGTGSSAVLPVGGYAIPIGGPLVEDLRNLFLLPSSPLAELRNSAGEDRVRSRSDTGTGGTAGRALGFGHCLRHSRGGRGLRSRRSISAGAPGCGH